MSLAFVIPSAHLGHWYVQLAFAVPSLLIIGFMWRDSRRRKRQAKRVPPGRRVPPGKDKPGR